MNFGGLMASSEVIATGSGLGVTSTFMNGDTTDLTITASGTGTTKQSVQMWIDGGTTGRRYRVEVQVHTDAGQKLEGDGILFVGDT